MAVADLYASLPNVDSDGADMERFVTDSRAVRNARIAVGMSNKGMLTDPTQQET
jgi:hypothetical protein